MTGKISNLKVTITGLSHTSVSDVDMLLVSPDGRGLILMSDAGSGAASSVDLTFDDTAGGPILNGTVGTGTYRPTDSSVPDSFPAPAPYRPWHVQTGSNQLSNFNGYSPNGTWQLFVVDDAVVNSGSISGGWSLDVTTTPVTPPPSLGCSSPSFTRTDFPVGAGPTNVAIADFNNDTEDDFAVTNQISNDVSILLGDGNGGFALQAPLAPGSGPYTVAAGKFNADSNFDLAVVNSSSNNVSIFLGNGNGTFSGPANFFVGVSPISISVGDFNSDTKQDLAVANFGGFFTGSVSLLLGNGSGGFTAGNNVSTGAQPAFVATADFNGDTKPDMVVANYGTQTISTFFGDGAGGFLLSQNLNVAGNLGPVSIEIADLFGSDGIKDLAVSDYSGLVLGYGGAANGTFANFGPMVTGLPSPIGITSGDFGLTGTNVVAVAASGSNFVRVGPNSVQVGSNPNDVKKGSFNGDVKPDLVSVNSGSNNISVLLNICQVATGNLFDFNGDRRTDFAVFRPTGQPAWWNYPSISPKIFGRAADTIVPADYDGDRVTDYAIYRPASGLWWVNANNGAPLYFIQFGFPGDIPVPADYDGDGKADIAVFRPSTGNWFVRQSSDHVTAVYSFGLSGDLPVPADYDGDGKDDIAVFRPSTGVWYIFRSSDSQFVIAPFGATGDKTVPGDYDGDAKADIAIYRPSSGAWYVYRSSDGGFTLINWGLTGDMPVPGDYDGDGKFDFGVFRPSDVTWYILRSSDATPMYAQWGISTDTPVPSAFVR
jgi:subtilisin-like proprotein convertase family protein